MLAVAALVSAVLTLPGPSSTSVGADDTVPSPVVASAALTGEASKFVAITPIRALDTRSDPDYGKVFRGSSLSIDPVTDTGVADAAGVDASDITAVVVNTTVVGAAGTGFATMWPTGSERLTAATNNTQFDGHTIGNLVIAPLGLERKISFYASTDAHVTIDVLGVFTRSDATDAGRFEQLGPVRHSDTRDGTPMAADETRTFDLTTAGVPADATGVVMNVTAFGSNGRGFYTVWASGQPKPDTANVNVLGIDYAAGNQVISGLTDGKVDIFTNVGSELTVDITGYFTPAGGAPATDGLYVPFSPSRFLDTRQTSGPTGITAGNPLVPGQRFTLEITGRNDVPEVGVKAVALNITGNQTASRGFVKAFPSGAPEPQTSSLNFTTAGQTVPNHAITSVDPVTGAIDMFPSTGTHAIVDATGYFVDESGALPAAGGPAKLVDPGTFVPDALGDAPPAQPYDYLFDRGEYLGRGTRPSPSVVARYSACEPLQYALNVDLANDAQIADLITSIEQVELHTGIDFQYAGVTSAGMNLSDEILAPESFAPQLPFQYLPPGADLVIGYSNPADTPALLGGVIGIGGGLNIPDTDLMLRGFAVIDLPGLDSSTERVATTTHELGHMMGLGHVSDFDPRTGAPSTAFQGLDPNSGAWDSATVQQQLMYPSLTANSVFSTGDIHGLWQLYGTQTCSSSPLTTSSNLTDDLDLSQVRIAAEF